MPAQNEPEKYSIDEMMERLKRRPDEDPNHDGELVTRADGTQAIRVRKRKRRSHQPHKEALAQNRRARMFQVSGALILLLLGIFAAGAALVFANSAPFRQSLLKKITANSGANVEIEQFRMNPSTANAGTLTLKWPEGNVLRDLFVRTIKAEISPVSFLGKTMAGEEITTAEGILGLRIPVANRPTRETSAPEPNASISFKRYAVSKLQVLLGNPDIPSLRLQNAEASFEPNNTAGHSQLLLNGGDIAITGWPKLRMDRAHLEFSNSEIYVIGMRIRYDVDNRTETHGAFELSGTVSPYAANRASTLAVRLDEYDIAGLVGPELGRLFAGRVDTITNPKSNYLSFTPSEKPDTALAVNFKQSVTDRLKINAFPFLFGLSQVVGQEWFSSPVFDSGATGTIRRSDGVLSISDINLENKNWMAVRGGVSVAPDRSLSGELEIGVAEPMLQAAKNRVAEAIFSPTTDGYRWIKLKISGSVTAPQDNFRALYEAASKQDAATPTAPAADKIPSFEDLTPSK